MYKRQVIHHADDQPVKAARRTGDDVEMTVCNRVKAAGVNCCSHGASSRLSSAEDRHRSLAVTVDVYKRQVIDLGGGHAQLVRIHILRDFFDERIELGEHPLVLDLKVLSFLSVYSLSGK